MKSKFINPALFQLEKRRGLASLIWFSVITAVLTFVSVAIFPAVKDVLSGNETFAQLGFDFSNVAVYLNAELLEMWALPVLLFVVCSAITMTTSEFKNGSFELIYSLNMSRSEILRTKMFKALVDIVVINLVAFVSALIGVLAFGNGGVYIPNLLIYLLVMICVSVQISVLTFALALIGKRRYNMVTGIIVMVILYLLCSLMNAVPDGSTEGLGFLTPLSTLNGTILVDGFAGVFKKGLVFAIWTAISVILITFGVYKFKNDDLV